jgi:hypothetical protein
MRDGSLLVDIKGGLFINPPGFGQASPESEILVAVDETLKYLGYDVVACGIRGKDRVQDAGIADGGGNILGEACGVALCLLLIRWHPHIGLQQEDDKKEGSTYENSSDNHGSLFLLRVAASTPAAALRTLIICYDKEVNRQKVAQGATSVSFRGAENPVLFFLTPWLYLIDNKRLKQKGAHSSVGRASGS